MPIHPTAIVDPAARINQTTTIGPYVVIQGEVEINADCHIAPYCHFLGPAIIGTHNKFHTGCVIGDTPQDQKEMTGKKGILRVGNRNTFREGSILNQSTTSEDTCVGDENYFMIRSHIGHDCKMGDHNILGCHTTVGGHVKVSDYTNLSTYAAIHPYCRIGSYAFICPGTIIRQDIPPYVMSAAANKELLGINIRGLQRFGFDKEAIQLLRRAYKVFYRKGLSKNEAITQLQEMAGTSSEVGLFVDFLKQESQRGIAR